MLPLGREWHFVPQKHRKILREKSKLEYGTKSLAKHKQSMMLGLLEFGLNNHDVIWPYFPKILLGFFFFFFFVVWDIARLNREQVQKKKTNICSLLWNKFG
jgi:hypothetical protein